MTQIRNAGNIPRMNTALLLARIDERLKALGLSENGACEIAKIDRGTIRDLRRHKRDSITLATLTKLATALETTTSWLASTGEVEAQRELTIVPIDEAERNGGRSSDALPAMSSNTPYAAAMPGTLPELDARAGAGNGDPGQTVAIMSKGIETAHKVRSEWHFPVEFTRYSLGADPRRTIVMEVIGDSMRPTLEPGDKVLIDTSTEWRNDDSVWLIDDGTPKVKRLRLVRSSSPARVAILSDNPMIQPEEVLLDDIRIIGRVCGRVSRM